MLTKYTRFVLALACLISCVGQVYATEAKPDDMSESGRDAYRLYQQGVNFYKNEQRIPALQSLKKAGALFLNNGDSLNYSNCCMYLGIIHKDLGNDDSTLLYYSISEEIIARYHPLENKSGLEMSEQEPKLSQALFEARNIERKHKKLEKVYLFFLALSVPLLLGGIIGLILYSHRITKRSMQLEIVQQKNELETKLLRSQINPHFIFNSLNSIQAYIAKSKNDLAAKHIADFALLMRKILNNSSKSFLRLSDEIETLVLYLDLEKLRYKDKFAYTIQVHQDIEEDMTYISPMLIQPFVENSIKHAFADDEMGQIDVLIREFDDFHLHCTITDNGIGIRQATKVRTNIHDSKGVEITRRRIELLNKEYLRKGSLKVYDREVDGERGTKVEIIIPIK